MRTFDVDAEFLRFFQDIAGEFGLFSVGGEVERGFGGAYMFCVGHWEKPSGQSEI